MKEENKHLEHDVYDYMQSALPSKIVFPGARKEVDMGIASAIVELITLIGSREEVVDKKLDIYNSIIKFTATIQKNCNRVSKK